MKKNNTSAFKKVGKDVIVSNLVSITRPELVSLGNHVAIDPWFHCTTRLETDDYVHISCHVSIIGGKNGFLKMGNFTNISAGGRIVCGSDEFKGFGIVSAPGIPEEFRDRLIVEPIIFEDFVNLGVNVTIFPGVTLPKGVVIGACSLVRKTDHVEPWTIYAGNPLKIIRSRPREKMLLYAKKLGYTH
jgi:acetyltransferase-like isoleucine patch superfamily enzyme